MNQLHLFLPCAAGVEDFLAAEVARVTGIEATQRSRGGVSLQGAWRDALQLNLHSRLAQRVLVRLWHGPYRSEQDIQDAASQVAWEIWFTPRQTIKVELTAQHSPLKSLNFAALKVKDAVCDRFRDKRGERPSVDTARPDVRLFAHLTKDTLTLYIDTTGEPLFKRGWREDKGDAPLKETLAAAMIVATGWDALAREAPTLADIPPLVDPCCGSGTIPIEAAQMALNIAPGGQRRFAFEKLLPFQSHVWQALREQARATERPWPAGQAPIVFGSDVAFRMVDFAQRNAARARVAQAIEFRGGDALQRQPPSARAGILLLNPPYGERIAAAGVAGRNAADRARTFTVGREQARDDDGHTADAFFERLAAHWKTHYAGWSAWLLTPDLKLPGRMRFKESRRVPLWNGPIECRLFRFDLTARAPRAEPREA
ncbi:MAG: class I SAM-dependent RNA methyltransferase [Hydrogenophaga sp.]|uniref:THUMP domain-containing class I SAM-dependent RNA methyltransferase n=1 Tax=Hydrogenophaga sp. TaxID=1904254 RepID=UPI001D6295A0|nr:THUMP domain-containing protein [Hydrogenophaga sp.]MBX3611874.1 class I SAM-dependent RNA methyltransferase [Hydrogenophaga sp.]